MKRWYRQIDCERVIGSTHAGTADRAVLVRVRSVLRRITQAGEAKPATQLLNHHKSPATNAYELDLPASSARRTVFLADPDDGLDLGDGDGYRFGQDLTMTLVPVTWEQSPDLSRRDPMPESGEVDTSGSDVGIDVSVETEHRRVGVHAGSGWRGSPPILEVGGVDELMFPMALGPLTGLVHTGAGAGLGGDMGNAQRPSGGAIRVGLVAALSVLLVLAGGAAAVGETGGAGAACKRGGWRQLTDLNGRSFKNQGQCVRAAVHGALGQPLNLQVTGPFTGTTTIGFECAFFSQEFDAAVTTAVGSGVLHVEGCVGSSYSAPL